MCCICMYGSAPKGGPPCWCIAPDLPMTGFNEFINDMLFIMLGRCEPCIRKGMLFRPRDPGMEALGMPLGEDMKGMIWPLKGRAPVMMGGPEGFGSPLCC